MFDRIISEAMRDAGIADEAFTAAIKKAGFKSRWDWFLKDAPPSLVEAYTAKVAADKRMHEAFTESRLTAAAGGRHVATPPADDQAACAALLRLQEKPDGRYDLSGINC